MNGSKFAKPEVEMAKWKWLQRCRILTCTTGDPDVVCVNIIIFTWTKWDESSKLPRIKIVQKSNYNKTKLIYL